MIQVNTLPAVAVEINGQALPENDAIALYDILVSQMLSTPSQCVLSFQHSPEIELEASWDIGDRLKLTERESTVTIFEGDITAVETSYLANQKVQVFVRAYDALHALRKNSEIKSYSQIDIASLTKELVAQTGLSCECKESGPKHPQLIQWGQSHLDFLTEKTAESGLYFVTQGGTCHLMSLNGLGHKEEVELGQDLIDAHVDVNTDQACRQVEVMAWNPWKAEALNGRVSSPRLGRRTSVEASPSKVGGSGKVQLINATAQTTSQAEAMAQSYQDRQSQSEVRLRATLRGRASVYPGVSLKVKGLSSKLSGEYLLTKVVHHITAEQGYVCEVDTQLPQIQKSVSDKNTTTMGVVTRVDDPDKLGRLKVKLPAYGDVETEWMEVCLPAAGANKGFVALPDVGDHVLVLMINQNPSQSVVMGVLYGTHKPIDDGVSGNTVKRYTLSTPNGQKLVLNDDKNLLRLENSAGSFLEMAPGKVTLSSKTALNIEAAGNTITIKGSKVDFKQG